MNTVDLRTINTIIKYSATMDTSSAEYNKIMMMIWLKYTSIGEDNLAKLHLTLITDSLERVKLLDQLMGYL